jgi:hypothetical protein
VWRGEAWHWSDDGTLAAGVRPLYLRDLAPNFRVACGFVEVPADWRASKWWPAGHVDDDAVTAIDYMIGDRAERRVYDDRAAQVLDDHRATMSGYRLPLAMWDRMLAAVVGAQWEKADEPGILARAARARGEVQS